MIKRIPQRVPCCEFVESNQNENQRIDEFCFLNTN